MARDRLPDVDKEAPETLSDASLTVGKSDDPIYLARSPEELRAFFTNYPTPQERATANLIGSGIRRLQDSVEMRTIRAEAVCAAKRMEARRSSSSVSASTILASSHVLTRNGSVSGRNSPRADRTASSQPAAEAASPGSMPSAGRTAPRATIGLPVAEGGGSVNDAGQAPERTSHTGSRLS